MNEEKYKSIDVLKFFLAIGIACCYHYSNDFPAIPKFFTSNMILTFVTYHGDLLVEFFFIISGFLFYNSAIKNIKRNTKIEKYIVNKWKKLIIPFMIPTFLMFLLQLINKEVLGQFWLWQGTNDFYNLFAQLLGFSHIVSPNVFGLNNPIWYVSTLLVCYIIYIYI